MAIVGYGLWAAFNDGEAINQAIGRVGWGGFAFLCCLSLANYFLRYVRWYACLRFLGDRPAFLDGLICYWAGFALTTTPGRAGEAIRCLYFNTRHGVNNAHSFAALLLDRLTDLIPALLLAMAAFFHFPEFRWIGVVMLLLVAAVLLAVLRPALFLIASRWLEAYSPQVLKPFFRAAPHFFEKSASLMNLPVLLVASILGLVSWSAEAYGFGWLARLIGVEADMPVLMGVFCLAMIAGVVTPGGLGSTEAVMAALLMALGLDASGAFVVALICRIATLWFSILIGLLAMLWLEWRPHIPQPGHFR